jgi:hypothetical protein
LLLLRGVLLLTILSLFISWSPHITAVMSKRFRQVEMGKAYLSSDEFQRATILLFSILTKPLRHVKAILYRCRVRILWCKSIAN